VHEVQRASDPKVISEANSYDAIGDLQEGLVKAGSEGGVGSGEGGGGAGRGRGKGGTRLHNTKGTGGVEDGSREGAGGGRREVKASTKAEGDMDGKGGGGVLSPSHASGGQRQRGGKVERERENDRGGGRERKREKERLLEHIVSYKGTCGESPRR
jgi:hypothetical protein